MNKCTERLYNGIIKENPTFILMLGMCPTLAASEENEIDAISGATVTSHAETHAVNAALY